MVVLRHGRADAVAQLSDCLASEGHAEDLIRAHDAVGHEPHDPVDHLLDGDGRDDGDRPAVAGAGGDRDLVAVDDPQVLGARGGDPGPRCRGGAGEERVAVLQAPAVDPFSLDSEKVTQLMTDAGLL